MGKNDREDVTMSEGTDALSLSGNSGTFVAYQICISMCHFLSGYFFLENGDRQLRSDFCNVIYVKNVGWSIHESGFR